MQLLRPIKKCKPTEKSKIFLYFPKIFSITFTKLFQDVSKIFSKFLENYFQICWENSYKYKILDEIHMVGAGPPMDESYCFWKQTAQ